MCSAFTRHGVKQVSSQASSVNFFCHKQRCSIVLWVWPSIRRGWMQGLQSRVSTLWALGEWGQRRSCTVKGGLELWVSRHVHGHYLGSQVWPRAQGEQATCLGFNVYRNFYFVIILHKLCRNKKIVPSGIRVRYWDSCFVFTDSCRVSGTPRHMSRHRGYA